MIPDNTLYNPSNQGADNSANSSADDRAIDGSVDGSADNVVNSTTNSTANNISNSTGNSTGNNTTNNVANKAVDWDRVERVLGKGTLALLSQKKVAVIGLGSGGGFSALSLAMSGVGQFVLIDDDVIEPTNIVRHVADQRYLYMPKVDAVASLIQARNPAAQVTAIRGRIQDHTSALDGVDLVVVGVDGEQSKYVINGICRERNLTAVYAGVYERGEGGDVVVIHPPLVQGERPCYACWAEQLREDTPTISESDGSAPLDYGMIGADGTLEAEPALWLHVVRVASIQAELALNALQYGTPTYRVYPADTVILANVEMEIFEGVKVQPFTAQWIPMQRDPGCLVCGLQHRSTALSLDALIGDDANALPEHQATASTTLHNHQQHSAAHEEQSGS